MSMWKHRLRVTVFDESSFSEIRVFRGTPRRWALWAGLAVLIIVAGTYALVARTALREVVVPGYLAESAREEVREARALADTAWLLLERNQRVVTALQYALSGDSAALAFLQRAGSVAVDDTLVFTAVDSLDFAPGSSELAVRDAMEAEDRFSLQRRSAERGQNSGFPYPPVVGGVSEGVNEGLGHLGVDLVAAEGSAIQAVDDGTVLFSTYTVETGYTLVVQHRGDRVSVYKHCATLLKQQGDVVLGGEAVALLGNTGTLTSGPHLHFEWWVRGQAVDPGPWIGSGG